MPSHKGEFLHLLCTFFLAARSMDPQSGSRILNLAQSPAIKPREPLGLIQGPMTLNQSGPGTLGLVQHPSIWPMAPESGSETLNLSRNPPSGPRTLHQSQGPHTGTAILPLVQEQFVITRNPHLGQKNESTHQLLTIMLKQTDHLIFFWTADVLLVSHLKTLRPQHYFGI